MSEFREQIVADLWQRRHQLTEAELLEAAPVLLGWLVADAMDADPTNPPSDWLPVEGDFRQWGPWLKHDGGQRPEHVRINLLNMPGTPGDPVIYLTERGRGIGRNFAPVWTDIVWYRLPCDHPHYMAGVRSDG